MGWERWPKIVGEALSRLQNNGTWVDYIRSLIARYKLQTCWEDDRWNEKVWKKVVVEQVEREGKRAWREEVEGRQDLGNYKDRQLVLERADYIANSSGDKIDAFPYNGPGTSNGAWPAGRDHVLHAFACRMSASRRKKGRKTLTFLVKRLLDDQTVEGLSEEAGGRLSGRISKLVSRQGQGIDALNVRSVDIDRHSITGERILLLLFFFFRHFLTKLSSVLLSSWDWCSYSENPNAAALLQSLLRRTQHCRFHPSGFA